MIKEKRLAHVETSLNPKQAVLLWLRQEHQGKTSTEYIQYMMRRPPRARPRTRVEGQVVDAIRAAMKGQDAGRIHQAVRQGQMYADFLILLVSRTNSAILDDSRSHWLQIALLYEQLRNAALTDDEEKIVNEWAVRLRESATELFSLRGASELIQDKYFEGEGILFEDVIEDLAQQTTIVETMMHNYDRVAIEAGRPELATDSDNFRKVVADSAFKQAGFIITLAKSKTLDDFGDETGADALLKSYILEGV
jgi:hypothetical protein